LVILIRPTSIALSNCKPAKDKAGQHPMAEALAEHEQLLIVAVPPASQQL
jgi:hypothetical protein